ncbi:hypothetical protein DYB32_008416 [Aphanomyces invadans]|uniref:Uncharacterized protein n=1 Tax=Aphanomyces invadans TaxID=157072 RepID=A0A3R6W3F6_9STRA|nr:hypothetical protein DYB32_008416 [Aphanomyces invadans]
MPPPHHSDGHSSPSPRKAKQVQKSNELRGLEFTSRDHVNILPGNYAECHSNGTGTLQDMLLFDQKLRDAAPMSHLLHPKLDLRDWIVSPDKPLGSNIEPSLSLLASNKVTFEVLTSDRGQRVISSLVKQWEADKYSDNTFFSSLPYVFVREGDMHSKLVLRYVSALSALKEVIVQGLFCSNVSASMAVTATLTPTHHEKIPLYWYCHQLEREVQLLKNSTADQSWEMVRSPCIHNLAVTAPQVHSSDIGLLQEATASVLLNFWKLPKRERMAFLVQVFSNVSEIETDLVRVLLDNSTYILHRVLEDLGFEAKATSATKGPQAKLSTIGAVVSMSVQASNQARQLHKWRKNMRDNKPSGLEPIQVRHKGIQVNGGIESDDTLGWLDSPPPRTPTKRIRRSVITSDKSLKLVLMQDYQAFGRKDHPHLLAKDMWTVSTYSENLMHHLHAFIEFSKDTASVPAEVVLVATMLLEWLMHEKLKAAYHAKDMAVSLLDSPHFKECAISLLDLFKNQLDNQVPDTVKAHAASITDFLHRRDDTSDSIPRPKAIVETTSPIAPVPTPADIRAFLRKGFPGDIVNQILSISTEEGVKEKESKTILLIEQLEHHMMGKLQKRPGAPPTAHETAPATQEAPTPTGFAESITTTSSRRQSNINQLHATSTVIRTLTDQVKALLNDEPTDQTNEQKVSELLIDFVTSTQNKRGDDVGLDRVKMLDIESLCSVLEQKVELELQAGPLDKTTRVHVAALQKFINKLVPEAPVHGASARAAPKLDIVSEVARLLDEALAKRSSLDKGILTILETIQVFYAFASGAMTCPVRVGGRDEISDKTQKRFSGQLPQLDDCLDASYRR